MRDWLVHIQRTEQASLQMQIREALVSAILDKRLSLEEPIPSTRRMAKQLGVSRNTVVLAYQSLLDDGFLVARERSGYYVADKLHNSHPAAPNAPSRQLANGPPPHSWSDRFKLRPSHQHNITKPRDWQGYAYPFNYGQVDASLFPVAEWRDCMRQALGRRWLGNWTNDAGGYDDPLLVEHIRRRILPRRGILAGDENILVTLGAQNAVYLLANLLIDASTHVAMEEPGYPDVRNIFALKTPHVMLTPVDHAGLTLPSSLAKASLIYVTPSHQFPTTVTMPIERRQALLSFAQTHESLIIEDDYEFETNFVNEPFPALKSLDRSGHVIYVGSLSKSMFPGLRLGFMVGPKEVIAEARALRRLMMRHPPTTNQRATALFLSLGHHDAFVRRLHKIYRSRWEIMGAALARHFPHCAETPSFGGTSYWVKGPPNLDAEDLASQALNHSILIEPGRITFGTETAPRNFFRLAFSSIEEKKIEPGIKLLAEIMRRETTAARPAKSEMG